MPDIAEVAATLRLGEEDRRRVEALVAPAPVRWDGAGLDTADVALLGGDAGPELARSSSLRWVHCDHAGLDGSALGPLLAAGITVSTGAGRSAEALAEHGLLFLLALAYRYPRFLRAQRLRVWGVPGQHDLRALTGRTVVIVGVGHTGRALAVRCAALGMRVLGHRRRDAEVPAGFDRVTSAYRGDRLVDLLPEADAVVVAASLNDGSRHLVGREELGALKPTALVVNLARGALVDEEALVDALRAGRLAGAATDVATVEPLPFRSPLWRAPNLLLTPHVTARAPDRTERALAIVATNVARWRAGESLENQLGPEDVWSGPTVRAERRGERAWRRLNRWRLR